MKSLKLRFKIFILIVLAVSSGILFFDKPLLAAGLDFAINREEIAPGDSFEIEIRLDTAGASVNAIEGKLVFPFETTILKDLSDGNSIINLWMARPRLISEGQIAFSGVIPGGYIGKGKLFSIFLTPKKALAPGDEISGRVQMAELQAFLNDGVPTKAEIVFSPFEFRLKGIAEWSAVSEKDTIPPVPFELAIARDPQIFSGKYFLAFAAQDKDSGIDHYEIKEGDNVRVRGESPYLLKNQSLDEIISVRAIDRAGNARSAEFLPKAKLRPGREFWFFPPEADPFLAEIFAAGMWTIVLFWMVFSKSKR